MSGDCDVKVVTWKRRHGERRGWQWCMMTADVCVATGWEPGPRKAAREAAKPSRDAFLSQMSKKKRAT